MPGTAKLYGFASDGSLLRKSAPAGAARPTGWRASASSARASTVAVPAAPTGAHFTKSWRGKSQNGSTPVSVIRIASEIAIPQSSSQIPGMKCRVMFG